MKSLNILIVEDEILIADTIKLYLNQLGHSVGGIYISYDEALAGIQEHDPDLVLLDIKLSGERSGIDIAQYLSNHQKRIPYLFLTSQYDKRILNLALDTFPYGYITKPFQKETLWTSIEAAWKLHQLHHQAAAKIEINDRRKNRNISIKDILYLEADRVYCYIILATGEKIMERNNLNKLYSQLDAYGFVRCHRSYIVNLDYIKSWNKESLSMTDGKEIPLSRANRELVLSKLKS